MLKTGIICLMAAGTLGAQAILHQGVAAAGGTLAGTIAGKSVSDSLDKVLKATDSAAQNGADAKVPDSASRTRDQQLGGQAPAPLSAASGAGSFAGFGKHGGASPSAGHTSGSSGGGSVSISAPAPPAAAAAASFAWAPEGPARGAPAVVSWADVSGEQVRAVELGWARQQVIDQLGRPASTVWIPEEGGLRSVLFYTGAGNMTGSIDINAEGAVTGIRAN